VLEVHVDWRTASRLYGSRARRLLSPFADALALVALRRVDAVRTVSRSTSDLVRRQGIEPAAEFPAYVDLTTFLSRPAAPLPERASVLFVGVLERYKNVDGLVEAWPLVAARRADVSLHVVGDGPYGEAVARLAAEHPGQVRWSRVLAPDEVAAALDEASLLLLPSRSEGLPRIALEALCRGRPVLATRAGGVPELVRDGGNGFLLDDGDPGTIAARLLEVLADRDALAEVAARCRPSVESWVVPPESFAERMRLLVDPPRPGVVTARGSDQRSLKS
jgi:glycosyltransferase involved in cell wall biosynthesis